MVNSSSLSYRRITAAAAITLSLSLTGCGFSRGWWGETGTKPGMIQADLSGESCPQLGVVLKGDEKESDSALKCWTDQLRGIWKNVQGKAAPDSLTEQEIATLVREGIVKVPGEKDAFLRRIYSLKKLAGLGGSETPVTREAVNSWLDWLQENRSTMRSLYHKFMMREGNIRYDDLVLGARISSSALARIKLRMESSEMASHLLSILDPDDREIRGAIAPAADLAINVINLICPTFNEQDTWDSQSIGKCVSEASEQFRPGAPWVEFVLNPTEDFSLNDIQVIEASLKALSPKVDAWFERPGLGKVYPARLAELARRMGANPPDNFLDSLRVIRRLRGETGNSGRSTEEAVYPEAIPFVFDYIVRPSQLRILYGLPYFMNAVKKGNCVNPAARYWTDCMPRDLEAVIRKSPEIDLAFRVRNLHFGAEAAPIDGRRFSKIMFFRSVADVIINAFHDEHDPNFISADLKNDRDNLVELISLGVQSADSISKFYDNFERRLQHRPIPPKRPGLDISVWNLTGFARLITMSSDLLVRRTPDEHNLIRGFISNFTNFFPKSRMTLDRSAITAILTTVDILPALRSSYLEIAGASEAPDSDQTPRISSSSFVRRDHFTQELLLRRDVLLEKLPEILKVNFPRAYESCMRFGFDQSCGPAINALLPASHSHPDFIHTRDLDVVSIVASGLEGMIDSCDRNGDGLLGWDLFDGNDELDCGFTKTKDVVERLLDSQILKTEGRGVTSGKGISALLSFVNGTFITRITGKVAMCRGTTQGIIFNTVLFPAYRNASLGSVYGLIADIADPKAARSPRR